MDWTVLLVVRATAVYDFKFLPYVVDGKSIRNVITRSCTTDYVAGDECFISSRGSDDILPGVEYTCISTCDSDGCNAGTRE